MTEKTYPVVELFGPTIQGEGAMTGTPSHFLRFGGCPLRCSWCDSMHAVDPRQVKANATYLTIDQIVTQVSNLPKCGWITLTGGDPCIHQDLEPMIYNYNYHGMLVAVETQGTLFPDWLEHCDRITFSPKAPSSGNVVAVGPIADWLREKEVAPQSLCIKVVVSNDEDLEYAWHTYDILGTCCSEFWFTAVSPVESPHQVKDEIAALYDDVFGSDDDTGPDTDILLAMDYAEGVDRADRVLMNYRILAERILEGTRGRELPQNVRVGCQQHVLLWPQLTVGV